MNFSIQPRFKLGIEGRQRTGKSFVPPEDLLPEIVLRPAGATPITNPAFTLEGNTLVIEQVPLGEGSVSLDWDLNRENPPRFPGDLAYRGELIQRSGESSTVTLDCYQIMNLTAPQNNRRTLTYTGSADCHWPQFFDSEILFSWEPMGEGVVYEYEVGILDCSSQVYWPGKVAKEQIADSRVRLNLPPPKLYEKYTFHLRAYRQDRLIGRLYVHDEGGANWFYGFMVKPPDHEFSAWGGLYFDGEPLETDVMPQFWFRNEVHLRVEEPCVFYHKSRFRIGRLPENRMGMSVMLDLNPENPGNYPGDLRTWIHFQPGMGETLRVHLQKIIRLKRPQNNGSVMAHWGASCTEKPGFRSPLQLEWESMGRDVTYDFSIDRMSCRNYNRAGTVMGKTNRKTSLQIMLDPSREDECYCLKLAARKNGRKIGMLITHGSNGYGWDYRFRIHP